MGLTGATGTMSSGLPQLLKRVNEYSNGVPAAVGFGVNTREHFLSVADVADGVVIGSQIITTIARAPAGRGAKAVEEYCAEICGRRNSPGLPLTAKVDSDNAKHSTQEPKGVYANGTSLQGKTNSENGATISPTTPDADKSADPKDLPYRFGEFGGQ